MADSFSVIHLSDLHFSPGMHRDDRHAHSIELLRGVEARLSKLGGPDLLVVSGDLTNDGRRESFRGVHQWIFGSEGIGHSQKTGLNLPVERVVVVPGNHDAFNTGKGSLRKYQQVSLDNYTSVFGNNYPTPYAWCMYKWIDLGSGGIYIAYVDSCYLGDSLFRSKLMGKLPRPERIAKGKLSLDQTGQLLNWYDQGMRGNLEVQPGSDSLVPQEKFASSLKILLMHHYVFEPNGSMIDYFMRPKDRKRLFANIALCHFDVVLCGHKHAMEFKAHSYGYHFDKRAKSRYLLNCARYRFRTNSLPLQMTDRFGRRISKALTLIVHLLAYRAVSERNSPKRVSGGEIAAAIEQWLRAGLEDRSLLRRGLRHLRRGAVALGSSGIDYAELRQIESHICSVFSVAERKKLSEIAIRETKKLASAMHKRPFVQSMAGSSAKASKAKDRSFNHYEVCDRDDDWLLKCTSYMWNREKKDFIECLCTEHAFPKGLPG